MESERKVGRPRKKIPIAEVAATAEPVAAEPPPPKRKINIKKKDAAAAPAEATVAATATATVAVAPKRKINIKKKDAPVPLDATLPAAPSKRKINIKPAPVQGETVIAKVSPGFPLIVAETVTVKVTPITVDGRSLYYNSAKGKVYDLKFKYLGRLKDDAIVAFPDSDVET